MKAFLIFIGATALALGSAGMEAHGILFTTALGAVQFGVICAIAYRLFVEMPQSKSG
ncbi:MAG TPA: hypothetical protein VMI31_08890 [Fimbriimonadaceae bacterium]|nr:hypothetical protein [Fimbriimonadaceae bacterium]